MSPSPALASSLAIAPELPSDAPAIEALVLAAFGPGRYAKTAERIRERATLAAGFVARDGARLIGSVRLWAVEVAGVAAHFLGPITVAADDRRGGLGADLVAACIEQARLDGVGGVLLVGDHAYFSRFGFAVAPGVRLPGPADPRRVLWLPVASEAPTGMTTPV